MPRVDFSKMPEWNLMQEIWDLDATLALYMHTMSEMTYNQFENDMDNMLDRLRGMIGNEDTRQFIMGLPGIAIVLKRLETADAN